MRAIDASTSVEKGGRQPVQPPPTPAFVKWDRGEGFFLDYITHTPAIKTRREAAMTTETLIKQSPLDYQLNVDRIAGTVTALAGDQVVARSQAARMMHETRINSTVYFPKDDVLAVLKGPTGKRTFCPFKGTAGYYDVIIGDRTYADGAWTYKKALPEAHDIEGLIGFMPGIVSSFETDTSLPARPAEAHISSPIVDWLLREAWLIEDTQSLVKQVAERLSAEGVAVSRLLVTLWSLHPQIAGVFYRWDKNTGDVISREGGYENLKAEQYQNSPIRHVAEGLGGVRQPLTTDDLEFDFPIMADLREEGATDYVAMPLPFSDGRINVLTMATDHPNGFTTANLGLVFECMPVIGRFLEVQSQRATAQTLLETYLGKSTGARVLGGEIKRGDGDEIEAAILFCDLRGSSRLSDELPTAEYLSVLNRFFETVAEKVHARGGEILKFVGDGVLAIFQAEGNPAGACDRAARAAKDMADAVREISHSGGDVLACSVGVCFGDVTYGNIGSLDRLDFTVIGTPANVAARLSDLGKKLGRQVLFSDACACHLEARHAELGTHVLHNVASPVTVYSPA